MGLYKKIETWMFKEYKIPMGGMIIGGIATMALGIAIGGNFSDTPNYNNSLNENIAVENIYINNDKKSALIKITGRYYELGRSEDGQLFRNFDKIKEDEKSESISDLLLEKEQKYSPK